MKKQNVNHSDAEILRHNAEEKLKNSAPGKIQKIPTSEADMLKLIHELHVHQIELEMQNDELVLSKERTEVLAEKYTELYDFAPTGYITLSKEGTIVQMNLCAAKMLGKERGRLKNIRFGIFISETTRSSYNYFLINTFSGKLNPTCDAIIPIEGRDDLFVHIEGTLSINQEECMLSLVDITTLKQAHEELQASKNYLDKIINAVASPIFVKDQQHKLCLVNDAFCLFLVQPREKIIGTTGSEFFPEEQMKLFFEKDDEVFTTARKNTSEEFYTDKSGLTRTVITSKTLYIDASRNKFLVGVISDITKLKNTEDKLLQETRTLKQTMSYFTNRELRMIELKKEVNELARRLGEENRYDW
ncbi:MAG: PAS domain S-box protein [Bacteroidota bacterium]